MGLVSAFLSGPQEIIPAGQTKVELFVFTHDNLNKGTAKWQIKEGANTYNVTADAGGHGKILVPSGKTYTVTLTISGAYEGGKTTSFVANSCEVVLCHFILGDQVTKSGAQVITGAKHFSTQPTADTRAYNPANKTDLISIKSLQESSDVVHTSGNETIDGGKIFLNILETRGGAVRVSSNPSYSTYGDFEVKGTAEDAVNASIILRRVVDGNLRRSGVMRFYADGNDAWCTAGMRASPGSTDIVNTKYVLDRVDELVDYIEDEIDTHEGRKDNPHAVTKAQVGLGNVNNTSDLAKPISTATQNALDGKQNKFSLYEHTIRIWNTSTTNKVSFTLTVLNQSSTAFTLGTLRSYLGSAADDYKQCSGVFCQDDILILTGVRGGNQSVLVLEGHYPATKEKGEGYLNWDEISVAITDRVRQIV